MKRIVWLLAIFSSLSGPCAVLAQSKASLQVTTDTICDWKLDGKAEGRLNVNDVKVISTAAGDHVIQAISADGKLKWTGAVTADPATQKIVKLALADSLLTWTDSSTGLMWAKKDNGSDVNQNQALAYCQNLLLDNYSGWRLPTIDELQTIYDPGVNVPGTWPGGADVVRHVKGELKLSGWNWSSSAETGSGEASAFAFNLGVRSSHPLSYRSYGRALCVRGSERH